ncbi:MAG: hypothetical protein ACOYA9_05220 [Bilifractor sp.]|jgi:hypothetical protein
MLDKDQKNLRIGIENDAAEVATIYGAEIVKGIFKRYDATCIDDLSPCYYWEMFGDLELIINDN